MSDSGQDRTVRTPPRGWSPRTDLAADRGPSDPGPDAVDRRAAIDARSLALRRALGRTVRSSAAVASRAAALSTGYRSGAPGSPSGGYVHDRATAEAYAAARMPATFAAIARAMTATAERAGAFAPTTLLDVGAGTGAAAWAATAAFPSLRALTLVDREPATVELGRRLAHQPPADPVLGAAEWRTAALDGSADLPRADLVTATYLLGELGDDAGATGVERLWAATNGILLLVEPGSRAGFERIRAARASLIAAGGHVVAPCPPDAPCPIAGAVWCHFLARLDRSPLQRGAKAATRSWEDEPFSYVAIARTPPVEAAPAPRVVLGRPRQRPGVIELRICVDGQIERRTLSRRDGPAWRTARDLAWGDAVPAEVLDAGRGERDQAR